MERKRHNYRVSQMMLTGEGTIWTKWPKTEGSHGPRNPGKSGKVRELEIGQWNPGKVREFQFESGNLSDLTINYFNLHL